MISFDDDDVNSTALCLWREARGDGHDAMRAVAHVILNRVGAPGFASSVHDVIFGKNQFTSMSVSSDPEFSLQPESDDAAYADALSIAGAVLNGQDDDLTNGAHYYCNPKTATSGWFYKNIVENSEDHPLTATIGKQVFYK